YYLLFSIAYAQYQALEIAGLRHIQQNWMILRRPSVLHNTQRLVSILGGVGDHFEEVRGAHMKRAGTRSQNPSGPQHLHRAQVEFLVAAQRLVEIALGFGEGRRIENDGVIAPVGGRVFSQDIEGVALDPLQLAAVE